MSNKNLVKCKIVSKSWNHFIINQKFYQQRVRYEELQKKHWKKVEKKMVDLDIAIREALYQEQDMVKSLNLIKELRLKKLPNIKMTLSKAREHKVHLWHWMKIEKRMLDLDIAIRGALNYDEPDMAKSVILIKELQSLAIQPLMLKKYPEIVMTLRIVCKYIGPKTQESDPKLHEKRLEDIQNIRLAADTALKKIQSLFNNPPDVSFNKYFQTMVKEFQIATKDYDEDEIFTLVVDPTTIA